MTALLLVVLLSQNPAPAIQPMPEMEMMEEILTYIMFYKGTAAAEQARSHFTAILAQPDGHSKIRVAYRVYTEQKRIKEAQAMNQATLNLERAKAYRDHLAREFELSVAQKNMEASLMINAASSFYRPSPYYGYRPFYGGYNGFGYRPYYRPPVLAPHGLPPSGYSPRYRQYGPTLR
jgi:hypothetical protein